jgi:hypothetical protein
MVFYWMLYRNEASNALNQLLRHRIYANQEFRKDLSFAVAASNEIKEIKIDLYGDGPIKGFG